MVACSVAALTVYDMVKGLERGVAIEQVVLLEKTGGRHDWRLEEAASAVRVAILTVSTSRAASGGPDESGERLEQFAREIGGEIAAREIVSDDRALIEQRLRHFSDVEGCDLVLTTGGTGVAPRDLTPEATRAVIEREVPGIAEAMREASRPHTKHWMLSRGVAGIRGATLIVNFPGQSTRHRPDGRGDRRRPAARARADRRSAERALGCCDERSQRAALDRLALAGR